MDKSRIDEYEQRASELAQKASNDKRKQNHSMLTFKLMCCIK